TLAADVAYRMRFGSWPGWVGSALRNLQPGFGADGAQVGVAELGVDQGIGDAWILFGLVHDPAVIVDLLQLLRHGGEVDDAVAGGGEDAAEDRLRQAHAPPHPLPPRAATDLP